MTEEEEEQEEQEHENKRIRPRERALGQKSIAHFSQNSKDRKKIYISPKKTCSSMFSYF